MYQLFGSFRIACKPGNILIYSIMALDNTFICVYDLI
jgi:hypothetical protein